MELFQEYFVTTLLALVFACVIAKLVSVALYGGDHKAADDDDKAKVVERQVKLDNKGLRVKGTKSKKRVKFADDVVVKHVDHHQFEIEEESKDFDVVTKRVVNDDDVCDEGPESIGMLLESMEGMIVDAKGERGEVFTRVDQGDDQGVYDDDDVCVEGSEIRGIFAELMERVIFEEKSEKGEIFTRFDQVDDERISKNIKVDDERVNEDGKVMLCSDDVVGACGDDGEKVSKNIGFSDEAMKREVVEGKSEDIKFDESVSVKEENVVVSGMDSLVAEVKMKHEEFGGRSDLEGLIVEGKIENEDASGKSNLKLGSDDVAIGLKEESGVVGCGENQGGLSQGDEEKAPVTNECVVDDDDDWEGIESTELEKKFGEAVNYVECGVKGKDDQLASLGSDVQMLLYGLHKIAVEGTCHEPQPMALNFSARAKWNSWQKLGSMSREVAMEDYIKLLSENVPGWVQHYSAEDGKQGSTESRTPDAPHSKKSFQDIQPNIISERELELTCATKRDDANVGAKAD